MKPTYLVLETPKAVATLVLVTVAFLCLGSSLQLVSSCLLCSLFSLGVLRLLPLFFVLRSWLFFFSLLCFFEKKQRNESLLMALFSSLYYVCSEGGGGRGWRNRRRGWRSCVGWPMYLTAFVSPVFSLSAPLVLFSSSPPQFPQFFLFSRSWLFFFGAQSFYGTNKRKNQNPN